MTYRESNIEITVRHESSPIVEIILKNGAMRFFRTTMSCPNMAMAEEYALYMTRRWKESHCRERKTALAPKDASVLVFDAAPHRRGASRIRDPRKGRGEKPALAAGSSAGDD